MDVNALRRARAIGLGVNVDRMLEAERPYLDKYAADLRAAGFSPVTVEHYVTAARGGLADPVRHVGRQVRYGMWSWARAAMIAYAKLNQRYDIIAAIQSIPPPPKPRKKLIHVPDEQTWIRLGVEAAMRGPTGLACVLWLVYYSGLRIGGILKITRQQAIEVGQRGFTAIVDKGRGGDQEHFWRPNARSRKALRVLLGLPAWHVVWQTVGDEGDDINAVEHKVWEAIPAPYHAHCFRHKVAQELVRQNIHPRVIMEMGNWHNLSSLSVYLDHVETSLVDDANVKLDASLQRAEERMRSKA